MTTNDSLNKIAFDEGFRDFTALMENTSLAYIADRVQKAMKLYAATITGANITKISDCCNGKRNTAGGFKWKYQD